MSVTLQLANGQSITIDENVIVIGQDDSCDISLKGLQPQHARIRKLANRWMVESQGDWKIQVGSSEPGQTCWLQPGDEIMLTPQGPTLVFQPSEATKTPPPQLPWSSSNAEEMPPLPSTHDDEPPQLPVQEKNTPSPPVKDKDRDLKSYSSFDHGDKLKASSKAFGAAASRAAKASMIQAEITKINTVNLPRAYVKLGHAIHGQDDIRNQFPEVANRITEVQSKIASLQPDGKDDESAKSFTDKAKHLAAAAKAKGHKVILDQQLRKHFRELGRLVYDAGTKATEEQVGAIRSSLQRLEALRIEMGDQKTEFAKEGKEFGGSLHSSLYTWPIIAFLVTCCFPVGLYLVWAHPTWTSMTKYLWTGGFALFLVFAGITSHFQAKAANADLMSANQLWDEGQRSQAVTTYRKLIDNSLSYIDDRDKPILFQRVITFNAENGNTEEAMKLLDKADRYDVAVEFQSVAAQNVVATWEAKKLAAANAAKADAGGGSNADMAESIAAKAKAEGGSNAKTVKLGTLDQVEQSLYENLPFADVGSSSDAKPLSSVVLSEEFCPDSTLRYRRVQYETWMYSEAEKQEPWAPKDTVWEEIKARRYILSPGNTEMMLRNNVPVYLYEDGSDPLLPLIQINASIGDSWDWSIYDGAGAEIIIRSKFVKAVRHRNRDCVFILENSIGTSVNNRIVIRNERWYAKGIGLVREDVYYDWNGQLKLVQTSHMIASD